MAKFVVHTEEKKTRRKRVYAWFSLVTGIACLVFFLFFEDRHELARYVPLVLAINCTWIGIDSFRNMGKLRFIEINEHHVEWLIYERNSPRILIDWNDIRRVKKENDGSVTIFQDSSFSNNVSLVEFPGEERDEILRLFAQYAKEAADHLVNFSEWPLALA
jgi:hypothetical protein